MSHPASIPSRTYALWPTLISRPAEDRRLRWPVKPPRLITKVMSPYEDGHTIRYDTILTLLLTLYGLSSQKTHRGGPGLGRPVHEEAHPCFPYFIQLSFKSTDAVEASTTIRYEMVF